MDFENIWLTEKITEDVLSLKSYLGTVAICSSECERGCNSILSLLFIRTVGPAVSQFDSTGYVQSWPLCIQYAMVTQSKLQQL
jgi:hypothetical protein